MFSGSYFYDTPCAADLIRSVRKLLNLPYCNGSGKILIMIWCRILHQNIMIVHCTSIQYKYTTYRYKYNYTSHKNNCQKALPAHTTITKRDSISRGSCEKYILFTVQFSLNSIYNYSIHYTLWSILYAYNVYIVPLMNLLRC